MAKYKMYGILKQPRFDGETVFLLSDDVKRDADNAKMNIQEYVYETEKLNPQFKEVYYI